MLSGIKDFILKKTGLDYIEIMLLIMILIFLIIIIVESVKFSKETNDTIKNKHKNIIITCSVFNTILLSMFIYLMYTKYTDSQKSIAYKLIALSTLPKKEETLKEASNLCNKLFNKAEKGVRDQFFDMKKKRPVEEVRNMCFNYARALTQ